MDELHKDDLPAADPNTPEGRSLIHQEAWDQLPHEVEQQVHQTAEQLAAQRDIELGNEQPEQLDETNAPDNTVMIQAFEWNLPDDGNHWNWLASQAEHLKEMGVSGIWLPPCCKATGTNDTGYGLYDLWDLGEFDQRGSVRTKYGTREELKACIAALHDKGLQVYADIVLNHKAGADESQVFKAVKVDPDNRLHQISEPYDIEAWTRFTFPGRQFKYSDFTWSFEHFTAVDYDQRTGENGVFKILGENKDFAPNVSQGKGNYDYLMFADIDYRNQAVIDEVIRWGIWFVNELALDGLRLDALKHINASFIGPFLRMVRLEANKQLYCVGEYWDPDDDALQAYLDEVHDQLALFDVGLHHNFHQASQQGAGYDLARIFHDTLLSRNTLNVATFVDNHDSQPGSAFSTWITDWFKPLAYALILLRQDGYPCVFFGDYYGMSGANAKPGMQDMLDPLLHARKSFAYGKQVDYLDDRHVIGWVRPGDKAHTNSGLAVVMSNDQPASKRMCMGTLKANTTWRDITGSRQDPVNLDDQGWADFPCEGGSVSVWVQA